MNNNPFAQTEKTEDEKIVNPFDSFSKNVIEKLPIKNQIKLIENDNREISSIKGFIGYIEGRFTFIAKYNSETNEISNPDKS